MCKGTTNWEEVYIVKKEIIPQNVLSELNEGWINNHNGIPVDLCIGKEIEKLIINGIVTVGCCCGHDEYSSHALALPSSKNRIEELGYTTKPYRDFDLIQFNLNTGTTHIKEI